MSRLAVLTCDECGEQVSEAGNNWYHLQTPGRTYDFCSWEHLLAFVKWHNNHLAVEQ